jgi:serine/threonine protein kinase
VEETTLGGRAAATQCRRGTPSYLAPELVCREYEESGRYKITNKVDIWAVGCILYELVFRRKLFASDEHIIEHRLLSRTITLPFDSDLAGVSFNDSWKDFLSKNIRAMLKIQHTERPTASDLKMIFETAFTNILCDAIGCHNLGEERKIECPVPASPGRGTFPTLIRF